MFPATIEYPDFAAVEIRTGIIIRAENFPEAIKPAYKLIIDFGALGIKKSSAQITALYSTEELIGKQVIAVTNFAPKQIGKFLSEVIVLGVANKDGEVALLSADRIMEPGSLIT